jgi:prolyl-tRNA editing enzyme YbaK/EbsC (Cys-tRNA(Pro) deacylase)
VRAQTGFAIGGVAPVGHLNPIRAWFDARLLDFEVIWAAAGTPRHVFPIAPDDLLRICGGEIGDFTADPKAM